MSCKCKTPIDHIIQLRSLIPSGVYCYDENGTCPFFELRKVVVDGEEGETGYCAYIDLEDPIALWDQIKMCGINDDNDDDEDD